MASNVNVATPVIGLRAVIGLCLLPAEQECRIDSPIEHQFAVLAVARDTADAFHDRDGPTPLKLRAAWPVML